MVRTAVSIPTLTDSGCFFPFASCMQGWHYRCLGLDPRGQNNKGRGRLLVTVTVHGSAGPIRFLVDEGEVATAVVRTALKSYARQGRLPVLGSDLDEFVLYHANGGSDALEPEEQISFDGSRNFLLCKKLRDASEDKSRTSDSVGKKGVSKTIASTWKLSLNKVLSFRI